MSVSPTQVEVLKRDRAIVAFGLAGVATLSWTYLIYMNWGMRHMDVGMDMVTMPAMQIQTPLPKSGPREWRICDIAPRQ